MVGEPFVAADSLWWVQLLYTAAFFLVAFLLARHPNRITEFLGKVSGPVLLVLIVVLVAGTLMNPPAAQPVTQVSAEYATSPLIGGFLKATRPWMHWPRCSSAC